MHRAALACVLILMPYSVRAQDKKSDWNALYGLHSGEKIELIETGMKKHVGTFSIVTEEVIQMREGSDDVEVRKENVARVTVLDKSQRLRNSFIFGVAGAGAGAGIAAAATRCSTTSCAPQKFSRGIEAPILRTTLANFLNGTTAWDQAAALSRLYS